MKWPFGFGFDFTIFTFAGVRIIISWESSAMSMPPTTVSPSVRIFLGLGLLVSLVQAAIFAMLATVYLDGVVRHAEAEE